jgi:hypothetical protein
VEALWGSLFPEGFFVCWAWKASQWDFPGIREVMAYKEKFSSTEWLGRRIAIEKGEEKMSRYKIIALMALFIFALSLALVGDALAGEKFKCRIVWYSTKAESINVPGEEGRIMLIREDKGILTVLQGSKLMDGMAGVNVPCVDVNIKTGTGFGHGVILFTDRDGDKMYWAYEGKGENGPWSGPATAVRGTGKFEGLKGKATWFEVDVAPNQFYVDWEGEMELPKK